MLELIDDETISSTNATRKPTADLQSRNDTSLSKPIWTDDDEQINGSDEYVPGERTSTSQSMVCCHPASSTDVTSVAPLPPLTKKSTLPSTTQQFYHYHKTSTLEQPPSLSKPAGRPSIPLALAKYRRISSNVHLSTSPPAQTLLGATSTDPSEPSTNGQAAGACGATTTTTDSFNEHLLMNKRIELLKTPNKQPSPVPPPSSSSKTVFPPPPPPPPSKRHFAPSEIKSMATTTTTTTAAMPIDSAKVTIGKLAEQGNSHHSFASPPPQKPSVRKRCPHSCVRTRPSSRSTRREGWADTSSLCSPRHRRTAARPAQRPVPFPPPFSSLSSSPFRQVTNNPRAMPSSRNASR